jgi:hypothetical protein
MAKLIEELATLPRAGQEFVLSGLANDYIPIEIDGIVYVIPKEVDRLIKKLAHVLHKEEK